MNIQIGKRATALAIAIFLLTHSRIGLSRTLSDDLDGFKSHSAKPSTTLSFEDVTEAVGIQFRHFNAKRASLLIEDVGSGAAWGDYDNDEWEDLYICNFAGPLLMDAAELAHRDGNRLYRNLGNGRFSDVTAQAGVGHVGWDMGCVWADYDNDGWLDLLVTGHGGVVLYHNSQDGTFADVTESSGLGEVDGTCMGAAWGDFDRDGFLDVYLPRYVDFPLEEARHRPLVAGRPAPMTTPANYPPISNFLFHNNGDGTFRDVTQTAGVANPQGRSMQSVFCDFDNDGWVDLYVTNDQSLDCLYRNRHDGTFENIALPAGTADIRAGMGVALGDIDMNNAMDMYITHWVGEDSALYLNLLDGGGEGGDESVPIASSSPLLFEDIAPQAGLIHSDLGLVGWGAGFFDFDNDGHLDLLVVYGSTIEDELTLEVLSNPKLLPQKSVVYRGQVEVERPPPTAPASGGGKGAGRRNGVALDADSVGAMEHFHKIENPGDFFTRKWVSRGAAFADYDHDGRVDVFILNHNDRPALLRNTTPQPGNWISLRLIGKSSNRWGVGARIKLHANGATQSREITAGESYLSGNTFRAHFGLLNAKVVEWIEIHWPSGRLQRMKNLAVNQLITITEPVCVQRTGRPTIGGETK